VYNYIGLGLEPKLTAWRYARQFIGGGAAARVVWNSGKWNSVKWNETRRIGAIFACFYVARVWQRQLGFLVFSRINRLNIKLKFSHPNRHFLAQNYVVWRTYWARKSVGRNEKVQQTFEGFSAYNMYRARQKSNPLGKILYLWNCNRYIYQICRDYRWGFILHILQIVLK